ncbi:MAG: ATP-binding protein [Gemmatimonadetes bacterium]|nr:MAG: ATP-binding protein [Gemmatimonadota bacterium]
MPKRYALSTAAGKDATLALHRARAGGLTVDTAFNIFSGTSGRVAFHGVRAELVQAHAAALGLTLLQDHTVPDDFEAVFARTLDRLAQAEVDGVVFGNVHLADVRAWYEERTTARGLEHVEPLWDEAPGALAREVVGLGYRALVVSVDLERGDRAWLGEELCDDLIRAVEDHGADPCGEHGEYHTFVFDGPEFREPVRFRPGGRREERAHALLELVPR